MVACAWCAVLVTLAFPHPAAAQEPAEPALPESFDEPIPLYTSSLGTFTRPISSTSTKARQYFDQGFQLMYAFAKEDAARSFREAQKHDPDCAICYWGEAWAWGSYLNGPMRPVEAPRAYAAVRKALQLAPAHASPKERDFIDALAVRYVEDFDPDTRVEQDRAYAEAMRRVAERHPDDLDAATLYADALFLLEPRRGTRDLDDPNVQRLHGVPRSGPGGRHPSSGRLSPVRPRDRVDGPAREGGTLQRVSRQLHPGGEPHQPHAVAHVERDRPLGRLGAREPPGMALRPEGGEREGLAIYPSHNLHMLLFAASMDGQGAIAVQAGKDYAKLTGDTLYHVLTLLRFGRFDEIAGVTARPGTEVSAGLWDFAQGYAHLRRGEAGFARAYLERVRGLAATTDQRLRFHPGGSILDIAGAILDGEIRLDAGDRDAAIAAFEHAVEVEDGLMYDEPEPLPFAARHWLGAALLAAGRPADAERVYRDDLADHPHNGWSLFGLQAALAAQGRSSSEVDDDLAASWARADIWLRASRF